MSQINDALKRAQNAQQSTPPPGHGPHLPPAAPDQAATRGIGLALPFAFVAIALLGLLLVWEIRHTRAGQNTASTGSQVAAVATPAPENSSKPAAPEASPNPAPAATAPTAVPPAPQPAMPPAPPPAPAPPPLKLQAVLFSGRNSTALINGKTVMAGDRVAEYHVSAINERSVTLISATRTNVLVLNQ